MKFWKKRKKIIIIIVIITTIINLDTLALTPFFFSYRFKVRFYRRRFARTIFSATHAALQYWNNVVTML